MHLCLLRKLVAFRRKHKYVFEIDVDKQLYNYITEKTSCAQVTDDIIVTPLICSMEGVTQQFIIDKLITKMY